ncbi:MAG: polyketide biosynthesis enoyl-CoA hydratase PksI [Arenicella sp.]|jgi:polyketide biosynthesis enoyl-CoA hydratase PksI
MHRVVIKKDITPEIVQVTMRDEVNKNTFSDDLMRELIATFKEIGKSARYKVVILTGYDTYFACGGTQQLLLGFTEGRRKFTDVNLYSLALDCPIPVISAMQGHGIGGGFVMGLFADFVFLSRESVYTTNFMKYGFTPGMGATYIVPKKLGFSIGYEMLLGAKNYRGDELKERGVQLAVLPRRGLLEHAYSTAKELAEKPRISLITLKAHMTAQIRSELPSVVEQELVMHEETFYRDEVKERIKALF